MKLFCILLIFSFVLTLVLSRPNSEFDDEISTRIVGGKPAKPHQFPYQVGLTTKKGRRSFWCGGALISEKYVLTAAHCIYECNSGVAFIGSHSQGNLYDSDQLIVQLGFWNFHVHESYDDKNILNDIALISLPEPIKFNANIQPAKLPTKDIYKEGLQVVVSGWGRFSDKNGAGTKVLHYVNLNLISPKECSISFGSHIRPEHLCADGKQRKSACQGDSGGPMVADDNGVKTVIGVVSFGGVGCEKGYPSVFTRVHSYLDWILKKTQIQLY